MGGESTEVRLAVMESCLKHNTVHISNMDEKMDKLLAFMAAQEQKNEAAEKERDRIFKASTLLPVAILTSVISVSVNYMVNSKPAPVKAPDPGTYILPTRVGDPKDFTTLRVEK